MRTRDYKVLKYVKKHPEVTRENLYKKFDFLNSDYRYVADCLIIENQQPAFENGLPTGRWGVVDNSTYRLNHFGYEQLEKKQHDAWLFWFPYAITTIIAAISAAPTAVKITEYVFDLFLKGTP